MNAPARWCCFPVSQQNGRLFFEFFKVREDDTDHLEALTEIQHHLRAEVGPSITAPYCLAYHIRVLGIEVDFFVDDTLSLSIPEAEKCVCWQLATTLTRELRAEECRVSWDDALLVPVEQSWLAWNDGTVGNIARAIGEERAFDRLPVLGDALEEAGCDNAEMLNHCRRPGEHARCCWVVDLLLGSERR